MLSQRLTRRLPYLIAGVAVLLTGGGLLLAGRVDIRNLIPHSPEAFVRLALPVVALLVLSLLVLPRVLPSLVLRRILVGALAAGFGWYTLSPAFLDRRVVEDFPQVEAPEESTPGPEPAAVPEGESASAPAPVASPEPAVEEPLAGETTPPRLRSGVFKGINHRARGGAGHYRLADGSHLIRLEDIDIQNGPDLFVYLVPEPGQEDDRGGVNLGRLKGNQGTQNYLVPAGVDPFQYSTVLIWCRQFATPFANATLS